MSLITGALNVAWRVSRDGCLYGISYAATKVSSDANTQVQGSADLPYNYAYLLMSQE